MKPIVQCETPQSAILVSPFAPRKLRGDLLIERSLVHLCGLGNEAFEVRAIIGKHYDVIAWKQPVVLADIGSFAIVVGS